MRNSDRTQIKNDNDLKFLSSNYSSSGDQSYTDGDYLNAVKNYTKAIELDSENANLFYNRGNAKWLIKDYYGAIKDEDKAITLHPNFSAAYTIRANCNQHLDLIDAAFSDLTKAINLDSTNMYALYNRGILYYWKFKNKARACMDWSAAGELGYSDAYTLITKICK